MYGLVLMLMLFFSLRINLKCQSTHVYIAKAIYTIDDSFSSHKAMVIENGKILFLGTQDSAIGRFGNKNNVTFVKGYIYPGFIDAHCHLLGYAKMKLQANLIGLKSKKKVVSTLLKFYEGKSPEWILGRGWDQNLWKSGPDLATLDKAYPNTPVFLKRIDGHAGWLNSAGIKKIGLDITKKIDGGEYLMENGVFTGVMLDNAVDWVEKFLPNPDKNKLQESLLGVTKQCLSEGLTGICDAGLEVDDLQFLVSEQKRGVLPLRISAMLSSSDNSISYLSTHTYISGPRMQVRAVKFYLDGALGSHGALLKKPYCDKPSTNGLQLISSYDLLGRIAAAHAKGYQICAHAIGDSAAKVFIDVSKNFLTKGNDLRWRMEHAQIVNPYEMKRMKYYGIIPSVQPTHATSDASWASSRICENRLNGAYAYKALLDSCGSIALGTDFPVEYINPINTFYSAVFREDSKCKLKKPFILNQALSRKETLRGMTIWAAHSNFMENKTGSLEVGKYADFIVLNKDLLTESKKGIRKTKVLQTFIEGEQIYKSTDLN